MNGQVGSISSGKRLCSTLPSTCSTSTGAPLTPSTGCRTTKPVRLVTKSVSASPSAAKLRLPRGVGLDPGAVGEGLLRVAADRVVADPKAACVLLDPQVA